MSYDANPPAASYDPLGGPPLGAWSKHRLPKNATPTPATEQSRPSILDDAAAIVNGGPREQDYGHPAENFTRIAAMWTAMFPGHTFTANDVAMAQIVVKLTRQIQGYHHDSAIDIAGYARCAQRIHEWQVDHGA